VALGFRTAGIAQVIGRPKRCEQCHPDQWDEQDKE
jgi:hypothetical protein